MSAPPGNEPRQSAVCPVREVRIDDSLWERVQAHAEQAGITAAEFVRRRLRPHDDGFTPKAEVWSQLYARKGADRNKSTPRREVRMDEGLWRRTQDSATRAGVTAAEFVRQRLSAYFDDHDDGNGEDKRKVA